MGTWGFSYDGLNRLSSATPFSSMPNVTTVPQNYCYDSFGNRWPGTPNVSCSQNFAPNNQLVVQGYDSAGNVTTDANFGSGGNFYSYDAENRVSLVNGTTIYQYDAEGRRVAKGVNNGGVFTPTVLFLYGSGGEQVTELDGSGNLLHTNIYAGGKLLASYDSNGVHYQFADWLGTRRVQTSALGVVEETCVSYPFGDGLGALGLLMPPICALPAKKETQNQGSITSGPGTTQARWGVGCRPTTTETAMK
jgi:YD repeat-containing protein